jgi:methylenetetrahydrofolate dehydrogenase (NADP+)/methenyltetrahydrofolate cyclohydrolase
MLDAYGIAISGKRAVVVGRSAVVGRPVASLLLARDATVVICHRTTHNLARETRRAELLVVAAGAPGVIRSEMVNRSAVIVDCGINATDDGRIVGDVAFETVAPVVRAITSGARRDRPGHAHDGAAPDGRGCRSAWPLL